MGRDVVQFGKQQYMAVTRCPLSFNHENDAAGPSGTFVATHSDN